MFEQIFRKKEKNSNWFISLEIDLFNIEYAFVTHISFDRDKCVTFVRGNARKLGSIDDNHTRYTDTVTTVRFVYSMLLSDAVYAYYRYYACYCNAFSRKSTRIVGDPKKTVLFELSSLLCERNGERKIVTTTRSYSSIVTIFR